MKKLKHNWKMLMLISLLALTSLAIYSSPTRGTSTSTNTISNTITSSLSDNLLQYEWPQLQGDSSFTRFSRGPAPEAPDILWKANVTGIQPYISAFNGMVFVSTKTQVFALDRETGSSIWNTTIPAPGRWPAVFKIDETHMIAGSSCLDPSTGRILWTSPIFSATPAPLFTYSVYSSEEKMFYTLGNSTIQAWNFANPSQPPTLAWATYVQGSGSDGSGIQYGEGKVFAGSYQSHQVALEAKTGDILWDTDTTGPMLFSGTYSDGEFFRGGTHDNVFYAFNASNGRILWTFKPGTEDGYWCSGTAAAYGIVYGINKDGNLYALDQKTGELVWKYIGPGPLLFPGTPTVADGKVYVTTGQEAQYGGESSISEFACVDAYTGQLIWKLPIEAFAPRESVAIAYGNLYLIPADVTTAVDSISGEEYSSINQIWAIGTRDWAMFRNNPGHTGVGQSGPTNLTLRWVFSAGGAVISSPSVSNAVVYFGSQDKNIYAVNARSGDLIWKFATGERIESSPAVANGKVYTGADDGYVYCLNALNGSLLWKTYAGGDLPVSLSATVILRSSPAVVGDKVYVGALDNKLYALDSNSGSVVWSFKTQGPITSSPGAANGAVYFISEEPSDGALYKLDSNNGSLLWRKSLPYYTTLGGGNDMLGSPTIANGSVFVSSNVKAYYAVNATTGDTEWTYKDDNAGEFIVSSPIYGNGKLFLIDRFSIVCVNATNGQPLWSSFLGDELYVSPSYADDKLYVVTDQRSIFVLNATDGSKLGKFVTGSSSWSSPAIYEGRLYVGNNDWNVYCLAEYPAQSSSITVALTNSEVFEGELVTGFGQLNPRISGATITVTLTKPSGTSIILPITTSTAGGFSFTFTPLEIGTWTATARWIPDKSHYTSSSSVPFSLLVNIVPTPTPTETPTPSPTPTLTPSPTPTLVPFEKQTFAGVPLIYVYLAIILGLSIVIVVAGYFLRKK